MEVGGEHAHRVVADPHRVASGPEEQPRKLTVTEQSGSAEVPGGKRTASSYDLCASGCVSGFERPFFGLIHPTWRLSQHTL